MANYTLEGIAPVPTRIRVSESSSTRRHRAGRRLTQPTQRHEGGGERTLHLATIVAPAFLIAVTALMMVLVAIFSPAVVASANSLKLRLPPTSRRVDPILVSVAFHTSRRISDSLFRATSWKTFPSFCEFLVLQLQGQTIFCSTVCIPENWISS